MDGIHGGQAMFGVADREPGVPGGPLLLVAGYPFVALFVEVMGGGDVKLLSRWSTVPRPRWMSPAVARAARVVYPVLVATWAAAKMSAGVVRPRWAISS